MVGRGQRGQPWCTQTILTTRHPASRSSWQAEDFPGVQGRCINMQSMAASRQQLQAGRQQRALTRHRVPAHGDVLLPQVPPAPSKKEQLCWVCNRKTRSPQQECQWHQPPPSPPPPALPPQCPCHAGEPLLRAGPNRSPSTCSPRPALATEASKRCKDSRSSRGRLTRGGGSA